MALCNVKLGKLPPRPPRFTKPRDPSFERSELVTCSFPDGKKTTFHGLVAWQSASIQRDKSKFYTVVTPKGDFRPFLWRKPKPYYRGKTSVQPISYRLLDSRPSKDAQLNYVTFPSTYRTNWLWDVIRAEDKFNHFLNFNSKLADQKVDVLTTLAEAKSTVQMVANAAEDLFKFYRAVRKADVKSVKKLLKKRQIKRAVSRKWKNKTAENRWLELQYGWSPLVGDIATALREVLCKSTKPPAPIIKVVQSTLLDSNKYNTRERDINVDKFFGIYKTACYYTVNSTGMRAAAQWNLGNNPLLTAWELVPYSFVVDWFIPIGNFLSQFSASHGLQFVSGTSVTYIKYSANRSYYHNRSAYPNGARFENLISQEYFSVRREVHSSSPIGFPVFENGLGVKRALNALALITQRR